MSIDTIFLAAIAGIAALLIVRWIERKLPEDWQISQYGRMRAEINVLRQQMEQRHVEHKQDISALKAQHRREIDEIKAQHRSEIADLRSQHIQQLETVFQLLSQMEERTPARVPAKVKQDLNILAIWSGAQSIDVGRVARSLYDSGIQYTPLIAPRTRADVVRAIGRDNYNILQIDLHGTSDHIYLNDNTPTSPGWWARLVRERNFRLIVAMACESSRIGDALRREGVPAVVTVSGQITEEAAVEFVKAFYEHLATGNPPELAVERAKLVLEPDQWQMIHYYGDDSAWNTSDRH